LFIYFFSAKLLQYWPEFVLFGPFPARSGWILGSLTRFQPDPAGHRPESGPSESDKGGQTLSDFDTGKFLAADHRLNLASVAELKLV
jgi:hypothetical protein